MKLWGGRFTKETDKLTDDFNSSISFDSRLYKYDITGSIAHAEMLGQCGIIPKSDADKIITALKEILADIEDGKIEFDVQCEDIHMNIEKILTDKIGTVGKKLHTARSRNDQVALDFKMYIKDELLNIKELLFKLEDCILKQAEKNIETVMPGFTHLQPAQPVTFAHHLMAYFEMFKRDMDRLSDCYKRTDVMPLGACALAGTTYDTDRRLVASILGFESITENSMDSVSDRDYAIEFLSSLSIIMMHLSRFCEEIILWCSNAFSFIELDDSFSTGSSIMPQKKNPDIAELIRGKTGRVYGNLVGLLTVMKGLPLSYNKDMQEDKEALFEGVDTVKACLISFTPMLETMKVKALNMQKSCSHGFLNATDAADYLVKKGIPFREAHEIIGRLVLYSIEKNKTLEELSLDEYQDISKTFAEDIYEFIDIKTCVESRKTYGGPSSVMVKEAIKRGWEYIKK
ncbi:argininosuccinate lyase 1 [Oxobacter pfennigii]|uniref:Argininosuccinate lyase n=1 Tax=Oxobacter pfennigii TaxID=36849 RepID=A0A0P8YAX6_9CLOT|nr:argininosuccinate lyase [Oxobacter pfennigii]KPU44185.1 argininosuccinate lyase 1 [Oxobacter pfennigii]